MEELVDAESPDKDPEQQSDGNYYDEEQEEAKDFQESVDRNPTIRISESKRIDDTFQCVPDLQRTMLAGVLFDYIEANLGRTLLFEKPREVQADRELKFALIAEYNKVQNQLVVSQTEYDLAVVGDLVLDLLRYQPEQVVNPTLLLADFTQ